MSRQTDVSHSRHNEHKASESDNVNAYRMTSSKHLQSIATNAPDHPNRLKTASTTHKQGALPSPHKSHPIQQHTRIQAGSRGDVSEKQTRSQSDLNAVPPTIPSGRTKHTKSCTKQSPGQRQHDARQGDRGRQAQKSKQYLHSERRW